MTVARLALEPYLGTNGPIIFYFGAIIAAAFFGGAIAGLVATFLSVPTISYLFLNPRGSLVIESVNDQVLLAIFAIEAFCITALAHALSKKRKKLERSEKELDAKASFLETVLRQIPTAAIVVEAPSGRHIFSNSRVSEVWRHPLIPSQNVNEYKEWVGFHPDGRRYEGKDWPLARAISKGEVVKNEDTEVLRGDGTRGIIRLNAGPVKNRQGETIGGVVICEDVTDSKKALEELRASEQRYRALADAIPTIAWVLNADGSVRYLNKRWYDFTGLSERDSLSGKWVEALEPQHANRVRAQRTKAIQEKQPYKSELLIRSSGGDYTWFETQVEPLFAENGELIAWYGAASNIDARKKAEADLRNAKEAAEAAANLKTQFLTNMSHEIRTPLNAIIGFGDLLTEDKLSDHERIDFATRIKMNGDHLLHLIDDILDFSKLEAGKIRVEKLKFSIADLVFDVIQQLKPLAEKKDIALHVSLENAIPQVICSDPVRIKQILTNLIGNAVKFTECGEIKIRIRFNHSQTRSNQGCLSIEVEDSGIGIDSGQQNALFQPFEQADSSISRRYGGTGLGLALSRKMAHALGGNLVLERSQPGHGSCFRFNVETGDVSGVLFVSNLHDVPSPSKRTLKVAKKHEPQLKGVKVLLAEDSPDGEALVTLYLEMEGAKVIVARDGFAAIKGATLNDVDIVLMDIQMPGLDGLSATKHLREKGFNKPIIALTAHALKTEVDKSFAAGCNAHLSKPVNRVALVNAMKTQLIDELQTSETH